MDPDRSKFFENIYARDPQIALVLSAVDAAVKSNFQNRFHAVLYGPPACGKTQILNCVADMVGEESVLRFDCTSTTKAGAEKILLEAAEVPPVMICEEIEKTDEASLRWLLGLLDHRAEIRKTNYRVGTLQRKVHVLTLATVNDIALFESVMDGALASRFSHKIYCPRPDKTVLRRILEREIAATDEDGKPLGKHEWIEPAIDYVVDREKSNDPRRVITVCLSGGDKLLTGEYQKYLDAARDPRLDGRKM
jgi:Cdc6-like AAA superfamily ATPase